MESLLNRYRGITVLLLVIFAQLMLLAVQVKNAQDVLFIRVWTVTAVTPVARVFEWFRSGGMGFIRDYILLRDASQENHRLQAEVGRLKLENTFLKNDLNTASRAEALSVFRLRTPSKTLGATIIGSGAASNSKVVFVDRGTVEGVQRGMAVVTPDGIVGKVIAAYPTASEVQLITDQDFAAGVITVKTHVLGVLKGQGSPTCKMDYVPLEDKIEPGELIYTTGDDRVFPRGFPVGVVKSVKDGQYFKEINVEPAALQHGLPEDFLILLTGVHEEIPAAAPTNQPVYIAPPPPNPAAPKSDAAAPVGGGAAVQGTAPSNAPGTEADRLRARYKALGEAQNHVFGEGAPGSKPPNFNLPLPAPGTALPAPPGGSSPGGAGGVKPAVTPPGGAPAKAATPGGGAPVRLPGADAPAKASAKPSGAAGPVSKPAVPGGEAPVRPPAASPGGAGAVKPAVTLPGGAPRKPATPGGGAPVRTPAASPGGDAPGKAPGRPTGATGPVAKPAGGAVGGNALVRSPAVSPGGIGAAKAAGAAVGDKALVRSPAASRAGSGVVKPAGAAAAGNALVRSPAASPGGIEAPKAAGAAVGGNALVRSPAASRGGIGAVKAAGAPVGDTALIRSPAASPGGIEVVKAAGAAVGGNALVRSPAASRGGIGAVKPSATPLSGAPAEPATPGGEAPFRFAAVSSGGGATGPIPQPAGAPPGGLLR